MATKWIAGMENGNSSVKCNSNVPSAEQMTYSNVINTVKPHEARDSNGNLKPGVYEIDGEFYKVGLPYKGSANQSTSSGGDISKYKKPGWRIEALLALFKQLEGTEYDFENDNLVVVIGIPTDHYGIAEAQVTIIQALKGIHTISGKTLNIKHVYVICQSEACFFARMLNDDGRANLQYVVEADGKDFLFCDIGFTSLDFVHIQDMIVESRSFMPGVSSCFQNIIDEAFDKDKSLIASKATPFALNRFLSESGKFEYNSFEFDCRESREKHFQLYAESIIQHIKGDLNGDIYDKIVITGGGAALLRDYLDAAIKKLNKEGAQRRRFEIADPKECQTENVVGYLRYGLNQEL